MSLGGLARGALIVALMLAVALAIAACGETATDDGAAPDVSGTKGASSTQVTVEGEAPSSEPVGPIELPPGAPAPEDDRITIVPYDSSASPSGIEVPSVMNETESRALSMLRSAGFGSAVRRGPSTTGLPAGKVYAQEPAAGAYKSAGTVVTVWVSTGPPKTSWPYAGPSK